MTWAQLINRAVEYHRSGEYLKALHKYQFAVKITPSSHQGLLLNNMALSYKALGQYDKAIDLFEKSDYHDTPWNLALTHLAAGNWREGLIGYRRRYRRTAADAVPFTQLPIPFWEGEVLSELSGKRVLVLNEQGFGDELLFSRALRQTSQIAADLMVQVYPETLSLFQTTLDLDPARFFAERSFSLDFVQHFDCYTYLGNLFTAEWLSDGIPSRPLRFQPAPIPLPDLFQNERRVAVSHQANARSANSAQRSRPIQFFLDRYHNTALYSLAPDQSPAGVLNLGGYVKNFNDSAFLLTKMTGAAAIDSVLVHLAGCLGVPTDLYVQPVPDWRWRYLNSDGSSMFYPTVRPQLAD